VIMPPDFFGESFVPGLGFGESHIPSCNQSGWNCT
jgi:hypothetical protein